MIVEPTPTNPRSPWRRALRLVGLALPVVLFGSVMAAGLLGPRPEPQEPREPAPVAVATPSPATAQQASEPPGSAVPLELAAAPTPEPPARFGDLPTTTPGALSAARAQGPIAETQVVSGFLKIEPGKGCAGQPGGDPLGPWCVRTGILADWWWTAMSTLTGPVPPHLHVTVPVGVRVPTPVELAAASASGGGTHVLVVGRFEAGGACAAPGVRARDCDRGFVVERFAWVDGVRIGLTPLIAARLDTGDRRANPFTSALDDGDLPLSAVLAWPDAVATIDRGAAALAAAAPPSEPVWYLRVLEGARGSGMERRIRWLLLAEKDLRILGSGGPDGITGLSSNPPAGIGPSSTRTNSGG